MRKIAGSKKFDVLKVKKHILVRAGMFVTLMRILHHNRILERTLVPMRHDSHIVLRARVMRDAMIMKNYGLVFRVAQRYFRDYIPIEDLRGYGTEGLIRAVDGFDPRKGSKFSSYAGACISQAITRCVIENETPIRLPENRAKEKKRRGREETKAYVKGVPLPSSSQKREKIEPEIAFSLDKCKEGDDGDNLLSRVVSENILSPEDFVLQRSIEERREQAVALLRENLPEEDWLILSKCSGLSGNEDPISIPVIARELSKSRQWIDKKRCSRFNK